MIASGMGESWMVGVACERAQVASGLPLGGMTSWELTLRRMLIHVGEQPPAIFLRQAGDPAGSLSKERRHPGKWETLRLQTDGFSQRKFWVRLK